MALKKIILSILACTCILTTLEAKQFRFEKITPDQPLFGERITQILKSSDGYIWICGIDGASKFDGYNTLNFFGHASLINAKIYGNRIGLLANPSSTDSNFNHSRFILNDIFPGKVTTLFSPQHGFFAEKQDNMIESYDIMDKALNIPIYSLYGKARIP